MSINKLHSVPKIASLICIFSLVLGTVWMLNNSALGFYLSLIILASTIFCWWRLNFETWFFSVIILILFSVIVINHFVFKIWLFDRNASNYLLLVVPFLPLLAAIVFLLVNRGKQKNRIFWVSFVVSILLALGVPFAAIDEHYTLVHIVKRSDCQYSFFAATKGWKEKYLCCYKDLFVFPGIVRRELCGYLGGPNFNKHFDFENCQYSDTSSNSVTIKSPEGDKYELNYIKE